MVGLMEDVEKHVRVAFRESGDLVALLGETRDELGASEFLRTIRGRDEGPCPEVNLDAEKRLVDLLATLAERGARLVRARRLRRRPRRRRWPSARCRAASGASIVLDSAARTSALLFGESTGRALISFAPDDEAAVRALAREKGVPFSASGWVGGDRFRMEARGRSAHRRAGRGAGRALAHRLRPRPRIGRRPVACGAAAVRFGSCSGSWRF